MKVAVVYNSNSGRRNSRDAIAQLCRMLRAAYVEVRVFSVCNDESWREAKWWAVDGAAVILVAGGDGTINSVANDIIHAGLSGVIRFAVLPIGSGNDFAANIGCPRTPDAITESIISGHFRDVDIGSVKFTAFGVTRRHYFVNSLGMGLEGRVALRAGRIRKLRGLLLYSLSTLIELRAARGQRCFLKWISGDGGEKTAVNDCMLISCANGASTGGGMKLLPLADPADGLLDLGILFGTSPASIIVSMAKIAIGIQHSKRIVCRERFVKLFVECPATFAIHVDGEVLSDACSQAQVDIQPKAIRVAI